MHFVRVNVSALCVYVYLLREKKKKKEAFATLVGYKMHRIIQ